MQSMGNEGIFQKNFFKLMEIYVGEKERWKFSVFRKTSLYGMIFISAYSPLLDKAKNIDLMSLDIRKGACDWQKFRKFKTGWIFT